MPKYLVFAYLPAVIEVEADHPDAASDAAVIKPLSDWKVQATDRPTEIVSVLNLTTGIEYVV